MHPPTETLPMCSAMLAAAHQKFGKASQISMVTLRIDVLVANGSRSCVFKEGSETQTASPMETGSILRIALMVAAPQQLRRASQLPVVTLRLNLLSAKGTSTCVFRERDAAHTASPTETGSILKIALMVAA